jgi:hypothetical protein
VQFQHWEIGKVTDILSSRVALAHESLRTPDEFTGWLKALEPSRLVGHSHDCTSCPLHYFLREKLGIQQRFGFTIRNHSISLFAGGGNEPRERYVLRLPNWAQAFVEEVDSVKGHLTAGEALKTLERTINRVNDWPAWVVDTKEKAAHHIRRLTPTQRFGPVPDLPEVVIVRAPNAADALAEGMCTATPLNVQEPLQSA